MTPAARRAIENLRRKEAHRERIAGRGHWLTPADHARIVAMATAGTPAAEIAEAFECDPSYVYRICRDAGSPIVRRPKG